jgi:hypothetical protein
VDAGILGPILITVAFVGVVALLMYLAARRITGQRTRFDWLFELWARAQGAQVYPPSLRGDPNPQLQEAAEVSRGDRATRSTPGESSPQP